MATENCWRARKIQAELSKLGIRVSLATVSRYVPKTKPDPSQQQRWKTFFRNHRDVIAGMDFFVVPTVRFRLLYVWFAIDHGRRRILHFNVTENPTARWVIQQLRETFPDEPTHRFLIYDNDSIFSTAVTSAIKSFEIDPKRTAFRSPWQNGTTERAVGSVRRELLDHVVVWNEDHLRRLLREYVDLLQRGACPHLDWRRTGWSTRGMSALNSRQGHRIPTCRRSPPPICLAQSILSGELLLVDHLDGRRG